MPVICQSNMNSFKNHSKHLRIITMLKFIGLSLLLGAVSASSYKSQNSYKSIELPVYSKSDQKVIHTPSHRDEQSTHVDVDGGVQPVYITFKTQSSPVYVKQQHRGTKGSYQKSDSKDEPHVLVHEVVKHVIQELKEIIEPYRKIVQVIQPVKEQVLTKVHKDEYKKGSDYGGGNGGGAGGGYDKGYGNEGSMSYKMSDYKGNDDNKYEKREQNSYYKDDGYSTGNYKMDKVGKYVQVALPMNEYMKNNYEN